MGQEVTGFGPDNDQICGPDGTEYRIENTKDTEETPLEIVEFRGKKYYKEEIPEYNLRTFYSHNTEEAGPGPGWDFKEILLDDDRSQRLYGRTFTDDEVFTSKLPDIPVFRLVEIE